MDNVTVASYSHTPSTLMSSFICPSSSGPAPPVPCPSGEVGDLPCVAFPWHSSAGGESGPGELMYKRVSSERVRYRLSVAVVLTTVP